MASMKLLRNGTVISFNDNTASLEVLHNASVLIDNDKISAIGTNISPPANTDIVDVTDKILTPGFVNTHCHMWQTAYRTLAPDCTLADYFTWVSHNSASIKSFSAEDVYVSCLEGYLEGLNAGVTSYVEHAHNNWERKTVERGYDAAVDGGARVWWCCAAEDRDHCSQKESFEFMAEVRDRNAGKDTPVQLGYAFDQFAARSAEQLDREKETIK